MAAVMKSRKLFNDITRNITALFADREKAASDVTKLTQYAQQWLDTNPRVQTLKEVQKICGTPIMMDGGYAYIHIGAANFRVLTGTLDNLPRDMHFSGEREITPEEGTEFHTRVIEFCSNLQQIYDQRIAMQSAFETAWGQVPSVSALIKAWPAVERLLPEYALAQAKKPSVRAVREKAAVDVSTLNANLLLATIAK